MYRGCVEEVLKQTKRLSFVFSVMGNDTANDAVTTATADMSVFDSSSCVVVQVILVESLDLPVGRKLKADRVFLSAIHKIIELHRR